MRKLTILAVATSATVIFTGCVDDVMKDRHYIPAQPQVDPVIIQQEVIEPADSTQPPQKSQGVKPQYEPMTDVVSSGGVDSVNGAAAASSSGKVYIVKRGDFPARIAAKNGVRLSDLMKLNNLDAASAKKLRVGQKLLLPEKSTAAVKKSSAPRKSGKKSTVSADTGKLENGKYTVKSGDTPERIARRFKVKLNDLMSANNLNESSARNLRIGQKLVIPGQGAVAASAATAVVEKPQTDKPETSGTQPDGSGQPIPEKSPDAVAAEPPVPGEAAQPVDNTVQASAADAAAQVQAVEITKEMTLAEFAAQHGVSEAKIRELNAGMELNKLTPGMLICIPGK